jgi:hypothetical protein
MRPDEKHARVDAEPQDDFAKRDRAALLGGHRPRRASEGEQAENDQPTAAKPPAENRS